MLSEKDKYKIIEKGILEPLDFDIFRFKDFAKYPATIFQGFFKFVFTFACHAHYRTRKSNDSQCKIKYSFFHCSITFKFHDCILFSSTKLYKTQKSYI